jgi:putative transposase
MNCYRLVADQAAHHAVRVVCRAVGVSRAGYYAWWGRQPSARARADGRLTERIRQVHKHSRGTYGRPRVHAELRADGQRCRRRRVARLMRQAGLRGVHGQRRRVRTTVADRLATPAPGRVGRAFAPAQIGAPNRLWLTDISSVPTDEGWLYLAVVLDGFSRAVVGWAMANHLRTELALDALVMALRTRRPTPGLVLHSDHGCQYTALASMGRVGDAYDNAVAESFFSLLRVELINRHRWPTRSAARVAIFAYIEGWYNRQRRHSTLGYLAPAEYEALATEVTVA